MAWLSMLQVYLLCIVPSGGYSRRKKASLRISWAIVDPASCYATLGMDIKAESHIHSLNCKPHDSRLYILKVIIECPLGWGVNHH